MHKIRQRITCIVFAYLIAISCMSMQFIFAPQVSASSKDITVRIVVEGPEVVVPEVDISTPVDGSRTLTAENTISFSFANAGHIILTITDLSTGIPMTIIDDAPMLPDGSIDITEFLPGYGTFQVLAEVAAPAPDDDVIRYASSTFTYGPVMAEIIDNGAGEADNTLVGDSVARVFFDEYTHAVLVELQDGEGNTVFETYIELTDEEMAQGYVDVPLPVSQESIANGEHVLIVTAFDASGDMLDEPYAQEVDIARPFLPPITGFFRALGGIGVLRDYSFYTSIGCVALILGMFIVFKRQSARSKEYAPRIVKNS